MAIVVLLHWREVSEEKYEKVRKEVNWENDTPKGAKFRVAWFDSDGLHVLDLWESQQEFERFVEQRLMPAVRTLGIEGQPKVEFSKAHAIFAPNI
jgi:hypothetical protein